MIHHCICHLLSQQGKSVFFLPDDVASFENFEMLKYGMWYLSQNTPGLLSETLHLTCRSVALLWFVAHELRNTTRQTQQSSLQRDWSMSTSQNISPFHQRHCLKLYSQKTCGHGHVFTVQCECVFRLIFPIPVTLQHRALEWRNVAVALPADHRQLFDRLLFTPQLREGCPPKCHGRATHMTLGTGQMRSTAVS